MKVLTMIRDAAVILAVAYVLTIAVLACSA
jgi:hypothetical protein